MSVFQFIVLIVGSGLLLLGGFSGYALFARALKISDKFGMRRTSDRFGGCLFLDYRQACR